MLKVFTAIVLGGIGSYAGAQFGLAQQDRSALEDGVVYRADTEKVARYGVYGAVGVPFSAFSLYSLTVFITDREWRSQLQNKGVAAVERLGFGTEIGIGVADALSEIER